MLTKITKRIVKLWREYPIKQYNSVQGWLTDNEAIALYRFASKLPPHSVIVEIGTWKGKSTFCLARGLHDGKIIAIDPFDASGGEPAYQETKGDDSLIAQFKNNMQRLGVSQKIQIVQGYSSQCASQVPAPIDRLLIDGDHSKEACELDFQLYAPLLRIGGLLLFHDFDRARPTLGPTWVVQNRVVIPNGNYQVMGIFDSLFVVMKLRN